MNRRNFLRATAAGGLAAAFAPGAAFAQRLPSIAGILSTNDQFSTLVAAASAAGLVETLDTGGPFTLFAPTNNAFAALPAGTVESLLRPENRDQLVAILTYHVVPGAVTADQILGKRLSVATVQGSNLHIDARRGGVHVNNAAVTQADIIGRNGVIHRINRVLLPR